MSSLERIVRPFVALSVLPAQKPLTSAQKTEDNITIDAGEQGSTKLFHGSKSFSASFYMVANNKEQSRTTTTKRVENPDDPSQFVDVEYIDKLNTRGVNGQVNTYEYKRKP